MSQHLWSLVTYLRRSSMSCTMGSDIMSLAFQHQVGGWGPWTISQFCPRLALHSSITAIQHSEYCRKQTWLEKMTLTLKQKPFSFFVLFLFFFCCIVFLQQFIDQLCVYLHVTPCKRNMRTNSMMKQISTNVRNHTLPCKTNFAFHAFHWYLEVISVGQVSALKYILYMLFQSHGLL